MRFNSFDKGRKMRKLLMLLPALIIIFSLILTGCDGGGTPSPTQTPEPTETESPSPTPTPSLIKNGNFEEAYETTYPKTPKLWSSFGDSFGGKTSTLSNSKYGIIDTDEDSFEQNKDRYTTQEYRDKYGDIANPGVHPDAAEDNTNIIMIYNEKPAAVKYKSQSITLPSNSYARVTLFVKTVRLKPINENDLDFYGATITLSGMEEPVIINGIISDEWKQYEFYLEGSPTAVKTFYIELGLGTGSEADSRGYTEGHAFFDEVDMEFINRAEFETALYGKGDNLPIVEGGETPEYLSDDDGFFFFNNNRAYRTPYFVNRLDVKNIDTTQHNNNVFAYSYINRLNSIETLTPDAANYQLVTPEGSSDIINISPNGTKVNVNDYQSNLAAFPFLSEELKNHPFGSEYVFVMNNNNFSTQGYRTFERTISPHAPAPVNDIFEAYTHYRIGVWVKTDNFTNNGLNIYLIKHVPGEFAEETKLHSMFQNVNTGISKLSEEDLEKQSNIHNKWDNWVEYVFYVEASPYEDVEICLEMWLGPKNISGKQLHNFTRGYAILGEMNIQKLSASEYSSAAGGERVQTGIKLENSDGRGSSSPTIANSGFNLSADLGIMNRPVYPSSWTGYYGGYSKLVGDKDSQLTANHGLNSVVSGIINKNYLNNYVANGYITNVITAGTLTDAIVSKPNFLMIYNKQNTSYGYVSTQRSLSPDTYYVFSVMVRTYGDAKASIYLTDADGKVIDLTKDENTTYTKHESFETNGWKKYAFYIKTGELSKSAKIELWNGTRDGGLAGNSSGYVVFDDAYMATIDKEVFENPITTNTIFTKFDFEGVDVAPTPTPTPTPEDPTPTPVPETPAVPFNWGLLTTLLIAVVLLFVMGVLLVRKTKQSKLFKRKKYKVAKPSYSRDKLKINPKKAENLKEQDDYEEEYEEDEESDSVEEYQEDEEDKN